MQEERRDCYVELAIIMVEFPDVSVLDHYSATQAVWQLIIQPRISQPCNFLITLDRDDVQLNSAAVGPLHEISRHVTEPGSKVNHSDRPRSSRLKIRFQRASNGSIPSEEPIDQDQFVQSRLQ